MGETVGWDASWAVQLGLPFDTPQIQEKNGAIYTKPWVVELMLDLAGYSQDANLVDACAVEPAAGDGAFLVPMARRLVAACNQQQRPIRDCCPSLRAFELDEASAAQARTRLTACLLAEGIPRADVAALVQCWVRTANYLLDAPQLPPADFVIGNPPYIRLEDMDDTLAAIYRAGYRTMVGRADLYIAFFEAALRQLKAGGVCAFICADRWMLNQYGAELRRFITASFAVEVVLEMHNVPAFADEVSAYPAIVVIRRAQQGPVVVASMGEAAENVGGARLAHTLQRLQERTNGLTLPVGLRATRIRNWFQAGDPWPCISPERLALLKRLEQEFVPLESEETGTKVGIGVATGLDEVYITLDPHLVEESRLLPLALASDTASGTLRWSGHYLVNPWTDDGLVDLAVFPRLRSYYERHYDRLRKRHTAKNRPAQWYRTIDRVSHELLLKHKLYVADIKERINPVLDVGQTYPHHNLYVVESRDWNLAVLGGLLLSAIGQLFVECYGVRMRGGYLRFQAQYLRRIRVPKMTDITTSQAAALAAAFQRRDITAATQVALDVYRISSLPNETYGGH
jgi:adenine-specific DNA-methyltransferase